MGANNQNFLSGDDMDTSPPQPRKRTTDKNLIDIWRQKQEKDREHQRQEVELREKLAMQEFQLRKDELAHEREKFELEKKKYDLELRKIEQDGKLQQQRFYMERKERAA